MIKGWKLNPEWVRLDNEKKELRIKYRIESIKLEMQLDNMIRIANPSYETIVKAIHD